MLFPCFRLTAYNLSQKCNFRAYFMPLLLFLFLLPWCRVNSSFTTTYSTHFSLLVHYQTVDYHKSYLICYHIGFWYYKMCWVVSSLYNIKDFNRPFLFLLTFIKTAAKHMHFEFQKWFHFSKLNVIRLINDDKFDKQAKLSFRTQI